MPRSSTLARTRRSSRRTPFFRSCYLTAGFLLSSSAGLGRAEAAEPVSVGGFVHADWVVARQSSQDEVDANGQPLNEDRFLIRRARVRAQRDMGLTHALVEIEANTVRDVQVRPTNVEASVKWPESRPALDAERDQRRLPNQTWFMVTAGLIRTPFGFEPGEGALRRPWLEQSTMSQAFFPGQFDLGFRFVGAFSFVHYQLGIMNGDPIGERTFPGRDPNKSKDLVFRIGGAGWVTEKLRISGGFSGLTGRGFHRGNAASSDQVVWRDLDEDGNVDPIELQSLKGSPAEPSVTFKRFALGGDLRVYFVLPVLGELGLRGEIVRGSNLDRGVVVADPIAASRDLREVGWYVGVTQEITRWAQIGIRHDRYNPDSDANEREPFAVVQRDLTFSTWSFMAAGRIEFARILAQYDHRSNALGRDASGRPTTLADDSFTLRAEARF